MNDPSFYRAVPPAWCLNPLKHIPLAIAVAIMAFAAVYLLFGSDVARNVLIISLIVVRLWASLYWSKVNMDALSRQRRAGLGSDKYARELSPRLHQAQSECRLLHPHRGRTRPPTAISDLRSENSDLQMELDDSRRDCEKLRTSLVGLKTPSQFEVPAQVLEKLEPLEQTRLLEAVQAYRVNAWTPAAPSVACCWKGDSEGSAVITESLAAELEI